MEVPVKQLPRRKWGTSPFSRYKPKPKPLGRPKKPVMTDSEKAIAEAGTVAETLALPKNVQKSLATKESRTNALKAKVAGYVLSGMTIKDAAARGGVSEQTVHLWKKKDPDFLAMMQRHDLLARMEHQAEHSIERASYNQEVANLAALRFRLQGLVDICIDQLKTLILDEDTPAAAKVTAIREVFDRTGLIKDTNVTIRGQQAASVRPEQLADAFTLLGISQEELKRSLPVEGTVIASNDPVNGENKDG